MRRKALLIFAVVVGVSPFATSGCGGSGSSGNSQSSGRTTAQATADLIRATERQRLQALLHHDVDTAGKLHAADFEQINPLGETITRESYIDSGAAFAYTEFKPISPIRVRVHGNSAVIRYESEIEIHGTRGHYLETDLYKKHNGHWQIVRSHTTSAP